MTKRKTTTPPAITLESPDGKETVTTRRNSATAKALLESGWTEVPADQVPGLHDLHSLLDF